MRTGRTLQEVAIELKRQREAMRDFKTPTNLLRYFEDGHLRIPLTPAEIKQADETRNEQLKLDGTQVKPNSLFLNQLAGWAKIPKPYFDRMQAEAPKLLAENINHWLRSLNETRLVRTMDKIGRAFLSHRYRVLDNIDVVESVLPVFTERGIESISQEVTDNHLYLKAVNRRQTVEVKKGDKVQFGVVISNSEVGLGAVHVDPLVYTLACENGAIIADAGLRKFHIGRRLQELEESMEVFKDDTVVADNKAFFLKLRDVVNAAFDETQMTDVLKSIEEGAQRKIGEGRFLEEVVEVTSERYGLNSTESEGILRKLIEGRDLTQWGLAAAVTAHSQLVTSYERATELEKVGGTIMTLPEKDWKELAAVA